ncbi:hypothetical protein NGRA_1011 [Nosema granulosis]|uniref:Cyclin N-terminal domain-containing protein n=1 Tax=Nosema granulosis TaxID=83296 RepID=A0A9P6H2J0_9MICR|nr:hypothetical protein NGRA_1011 [Nosema granulosis]
MNHSPSSHRLRSFLSLSIPDTFTVDRICRCIYRGQLSLYTIFTAKHIYDKALQRINFDETLKHHRKLVENHYLVFISCVIIASKVYMDLSYTNISWTEICHFPVVHLNRTERLVLRIIDYDVIVPFPILEQISISYGCSRKHQKKNEERCGVFRRFFSRILSPFMCMS